MSADANPQFLDEPVPQVQVCVVREKVPRAEWRNQRRKKNAFDVAATKIPFPYCLIYVGEATRPLPVTIVEAIHSAPRPITGSSTDKTA